MRRLVFALALLLVVGCGGPPHPIGMFAPAEVTELARTMAQKLDKQSRAGWNESVVLDDGLPVLRLGECENRTGETLDTVGLLMRIVWELEVLGAVVFDPDVASLVLDVKVDLKPDGDVRVYTVGMWVTEKDPANAGNYTIAAATEIRH